MRIVPEAVAQRSAPVYRGPMIRLARPGLVDVAVAAALCAAAALDVLLNDVGAPLGAKLAAVVLTTVPLAWRSLAPVAIVGATMGGLAGAVLLGLPTGDLLVPYLAPLVAVYSAGVHSPGRGLVAAAALAFAAWAALVAADPEGRVADLGFAAAGIAAALAVGRAVRAMGFESDVLAARASELERRRDEEARAAIAAERARIARELHDVIGHSISVMGVQAGAVRRVLGPEQRRERDALLAVERTGRDAVTEMRRLLGFLRSDEEPAAHEPPATVERVDDLVAEMRHAGLDVELRMHGDLGDLSPGRALAAFRILQEALTNALKHAPAAHVTAVVERTPRGIRIEVSDDGPGGMRRNGAGYGLVGMRERVAMYGGSLDAGPRPESGFAVVATLPTAD